MSAKLKELREKYFAKQDFLATAFEKAKLDDGSYDFLKVEGFQGLSSNTACKERIDELSAELAVLHDEIKGLEATITAEQRVRDLIRQREEIEEPMFFPPGKDHGPDRRRLQQKSLGELVKEVWPKNGPRNGTYVDQEFGEFDAKTLMETTAGFAPETIRIPRIAEFAHRPVEVTDLFPILPTTQSAVVFMEETTSTLAAAETGEGLAFPEAAFAWTERSVMVRKIPAWLPVTDEQLADVPQVQGIIDTRLRFAARQRLDFQLVQGNGVGVNIAGLLNTSGIQTQAKGGDNTPDAFFKAMVKVQHTGFAIPSAHIINPTNWQDVRLMRTVDGVYIWGNPSEAGPMRMWGVPVAVTGTAPVGTGVTGDFTNHCALYMRQGVEVTVGFINDDFIKGRQAMRVTMRAVLVVYRPLAISSITGL